MIVAYTGTQQGMTANQRLAVKGLLIALMPDLALHGGCVGADAEFHQLLVDFAIPHKVYPSDIKSKQALLPPGANKQPQLPPLVRNKFMVHLADVLIATPREDHEVVRSGTWSTIRRAREAKRRHYIVYPDGHIEEKLPDGNS